MSDGPRKTRLPPGYQRQLLVMAISGLSLVIALVALALLLRYLG